MAGPWIGEFVPDLRLLLTVEREVPMWFRPTVDPASVGADRLPVWVLSDAGTTYVKLFLDGLCVYVNSSNKLANLSIGELSDIFTGVRTSWSQIPGSGLSTTIDAVGCSFVFPATTFSFSLCPSRSS